jgi:hypothetical protein
MRHLSAATGVTLAFRLFGTIGQTPLDAGRCRWIDDFVQLTFEAVA